MSINLKPFESSAQFTFFHTQAWLAAVLAAFPRWRDVSQIITLPDGRAVWLPLLQTDRIGPWRWLESMPLAFFGGPVVNEGLLVRRDLEFIVQEIKAGAGFINFNLEPGHSLAHTGAIPAGAFPITTHCLELTVPFEAVQRGFNKMTQRHIRRAEREGVTVRRGRGEADFFTYFKLSEQAAQQRWGLSQSPFPKLLYKLLAELPDEHIKLWLADWQRQTIGGLISVHYAADRAMYWGSALDPAHTRLSPTKLLQQEAIRAACAASIKMYNMGPSVGFDGTPLEGVRQAKEAFGAQPQEYAAMILMNPWAMRVRAVRDRLKR